jgi:non-ribosomal peptide synthetase component E (peptide arylation enzyme)
MTQSLYNSLNLQETGIQKGLPQTHITYMASERLRKCTCSKQRYICALDDASDYFLENPSNDVPFPIYLEI